MNEALYALAHRWNEEAEHPSVRDGSKEAEVRNAHDDGFREALRQCAKDVQVLMALLTPKCGD